jgi:hypothetical protein
VTGTRHGDAVFSEVADGPMLDACLVTSFLLNIDHPGTGLKRTLQIGPGDDVTFAVFYRQSMETN